MLFTLIAIITALIGMALIVLALGEAISEKAFIKKAVKTEGKVVAFLEKSLEEYVEFEELGKYKWVKPIIEFQDSEGGYYRVKSRRYHTIDEAKGMKEMDIWYEEDDPTSAKVDGVYMMSPQNQKVMIIIGVSVIVVGTTILFNSKMLTSMFGFNVG